MAGDDKAIIFDVGGVLLDYDRDNLLDNISNDCDSNTHTETIASLIASLKISRGFNTPRTLFDNLKANHGLSMSFEELSTYWNSGFSKRDWIPELLTDLADRSTLVILSDTNALHWEYILANILDLSVFEHVFVSHELGMMKDSRDVFDQVIDEISLPPKQLLLIDDTFSNTVHASSAGIATHHYKNKAEMLLAIDSHLAI